MTNSLNMMSGLRSFDGKVKKLVLIGQTKEKDCGMCEETWL